MKIRMDQEQLLLLIAVSISVGVILGYNLLMPVEKSQGFVEFAIVGEDMNIGSSKKDIVNDNLRLNIFIANMQGRDGQYVVLTKLGDLSTEIDRNRASEAQELLRTRMDVKNGERRTMPIDISIERELVSGNRLILELWVQNEISKEIEYTGKFLYLWLDA